MDPWLHKKVDRLIVCRITPEDWSTYKKLRLRALELAPDSFGSKFEDSLILANSEWQTRVDRFSKSDDAINFIAFDVSENKSETTATGSQSSKSHTPLKAVGMVSCFVTGEAEMVQMWVEPEARGTGVAKLLIGELKSWLGRKGHPYLRAKVYESNIAALRLYLSSGFKEIKREQSGLEGPKAVDITLECPIFMVIRDL